MLNTWDVIKSLIKSDSDITNFFIIIIFAVGIFGILGRIIRKKNKIILILPNIAVSFGILGTFTGIYIGLMEFDVSNISTCSIPQLLEGLKTAFTTSILGMFVSILLRIIYEIKDAFEEDKKEIEDPIPLLQEIKKGIENLGVSSKEIESAIVTCFRSEEEYSLLSQLKLMRQEITDTRRETIKSFENFAEKFSEMGTKALVKALEDVINDFNVLLNELVSDSFKELSQAMIKLVDWQDKYRIDMEQMQENITALMAQMEASVSILNQSVEKLISIDNNLSNISISIGKISVSAEDIENHVELLKNQNAMLKEGIEGIRQIGQEAKTAIPTLTKHLEEITDNLLKTVSNTSQKLEDANNAIGNFVNTSTKEIQNAAEEYAGKVQESMNKIDKNFERVITETSNSLTKYLKEITDKLAETVSNNSRKLEESNNMIKGTVENTANDINEAVKKLIEDVEKAVREIDKGLEQGLTKSLNSLAGQLVALSGKFVEDYTPLTERLRELVRLAEKIEKSRLGEHSNVN